MGARDMIVSLLIFLTSSQSWATEVRQPVNPAICITTTLGENGVWNVGDTNWNAQLVKILGRVSSPNSSDFTKKDWRVLYGLGLTPADVAIKNWSDIRAKIIALVNKAAAATPSVAMA